MSEAQEILHLIEMVDPGDTAKLDEMDARVWCLLNNEPFVCMGLLKPIFICGSVHCPSWDRNLSDIPKYSRSRDALKAIRPYRWKFKISDMLEGWPSAYRCELYKNDTDVSALSMGLTEELAELHAIIQAIAYERGMNANN